MPMPKPMNDESHNDFISRCMGDEMMMEDMPDAGQRTAVCQAQWEEMHKSAGTAQRKALCVTFKAEKEGSFVARFARLNERDKDNDITVPGAFPAGKQVLISAYMHGSWGGALPVGKATIAESGDEVVAEGQFNLALPSGRDTYEAVKFAGDLQEWSYGFIPTEFDFGEQDGVQVRFLKALDVFEISPVLRGAGMDTRTLAIKSVNGPMTLADQTEAALAAVSGVVARVKALAALRRGDGKKAMTGGNRERMMGMMAQMGQMMHDMQEMMAEMEPDDSGKAAGRQALLKLLKTKINLEV